MMVRTRLADAHRHAVPRRPLQRHSLLLAALFVATAELGGIARAECTPSAACEAAGTCEACSFRGVCSPAGLCVCDDGWGNHPCSNRAYNLQTACANAGETWTPTTHANVICNYCASPPSTVRNSVDSRCGLTDSRLVAQGSGGPHPCCSASILSPENRVILAA